MATSLEKYAPVVLRLGIVGVLAWFGYSQVAAPGQWESWVPAWTSGLGLSAHTVVLANGGFELIAAVLLLLGLYTRLVAFLVALHLFLIVFEIGLTAIGVRDFGLAMASLALSFGAADALTLDRRMRRPAIQEI